MSDRDAALLEQAYAEADRASWLFAAPNPKVGALVLRGDHVVGRGFHACWGGPHAEQAALEDAGPGSIDQVVVTLEPCSSRGGEKKRPACTDLLLERGVQRVLVGAVDPDPRHAGGGFDRLREAGVEVVLRKDRFQARFEEQNPAYIRSQKVATRPFVILKWAASADGKTACDSGASQWITGSESRAELHAVRATSDAILCGPRTLLRDDPALTARPLGRLAEHQPLRVLLDPHAELAPDARAFQSDAPLLHVVGEGSSPTESSAGRQLVEPLAAGRFDLVSLLQKLRADHGVVRLLVEGGASLHGALLDAGLVDALLRYEAPLLLGGHHGACLGEGYAEPRDGLQLHAEERADCGTDLRRAFLVR